jgi:hypothetical protein
MESHFVDALVTSLMGWLITDYRFEFAYQDVLIYKCREYYDASLDVLNLGSFVVL